MGDFDLILSRIGQVYQGGRSLALLFDYDGTLAPIRPAPEQAAMLIPVREALARLAALERVGVGVISGRALDDVRKMVRIDGVYLAGTSGLEVDLLGRILMPPDCESFHSPLRRIGRELTDVSVHYDGAWVERKPLGLTMHYRAVPPDLIANLKREADEVLRPWLGQVRVDEVALALEIVPNFGWDKGSAVRLILADMGNDAYPIFAGDSANDKEAFAAAQAAGGFGIGVGSEVGKADAKLPGPSAVGSLVVLLANTLFEPSKSLIAAPEGESP